MFVGPPWKIKEGPPHQNSIFYEDSITGIRMASKQRTSKCLHNETGDRMLRQIMNSSRYRQIYQKDTL